MKILQTAILLFAFVFSIHAQQKWERKYERQRVFVENNGQFSQEEKVIGEKILFAADWGSTRIFFTTHGWVYSFLEVEKKEGISKNNPVKSVAEYKEIEREDAKFSFRKDFVTVHLNGSECRYAPQELCEFYSNYSVDKDGLCAAVKGARCYKNLRIENAWPGVDIVFSVHPENGIKYAFELSNEKRSESIELEYSRDVQIIDGAVHIPTEFGDIIDHEPYSFETRSKQFVSSQFIQKASNKIGFKVYSNSHNVPVTIDPWVQTPNFASNWDCVWECETDIAGNVYLIGGVMPMQLLKYNSAGILQWTYNTPYDTSNVWLGTFATDNLGNSYVTAGSTAAIQKINSSGGLVWNNPNPGGILSSDEFWNISFNCDQSKLVVGGTTGFATNLLAGIFEIDVATGNVLNTQTVATGNAFSFPPTIQEVRSISANPNGKYFWLTQDTLGVIHQNFDLCGNNNSLLYKISSGYNLGYKCEEFRVNNTGIMAIRATDSFIYTQNGTQVQKRNLTTGAVLNSANIPGGNATAAFGDYSVSNSGLAIDDCGNVFVGSTNGVIKFDANLNQLANYPTTFKVYDVHIGLNGDIVACGSTGNYNSAVRSGSVQVFAAGACSTIPIVCCDATICHPSDFCITDGAVTLTAATTGGTWSGPGVSSTGVFTPSLAGTGTYTITYTLACGSESVQINVSPCAGLDVCIDENGNWQASGGVAPYNWQSQITTQDCSACFPAIPPFIQPCSQPPGCAVNVTTWNTFSTNTSIPAPAALPVQVIDATGQSLLISSAAQLSNCAVVLPCPEIITTVTALTPVTCYGESTGSLSVQSSGGQEPYLYNWQQGQHVGDTWGNIPSGDYTVISTDANGCSDTLSITLDSPPVFELTLVSSLPAGCNNSTGSATVSVTGGIGAPTIVWSPFGGNQLTAGGLIGGIYIVTATDANNCESSLTVEITEPSVSISGDTLLCPGETTQLVASSLNLINPISYLWSNGSVASTISETPTFSTTYAVTATDGNGCSVNASVDVVVENLNWNISANPIQGFIPFQVNFVNQSNATLNYTWDFGNGLTASTSGNETTSSLYSASGVYTVVIGSNGNCPSTFSLTVTALESQPLNVIVPTIFTQDSDGINDVFTIFSENALTQKAQIFNRWGHVVAELNAPNSVWDGYLNGNKASDGTYYIIYDVQGDNGQQVLGSGYFQKVSE